MKTATTKTLLQRINESVDPTPVIEHSSNVFTTRDYCRAVGIGETTAFRRIQELLRRNEIRKVKVKSERGLQRAFEYLGRD